MRTLDFDYRAGFYLRLAIQNQFDVFRVDIHAGCSNYYFFSTASKVEISLVIQLAEIASSKPTVIRIWRAGFVPVSGRDIFTAHQNLAVGRELQFLSRHNLADRTTC